MQVGSGFCCCCCFVLCFALGEMNRQYKETTGLDKALGRWLGKLPMQRCGHQSL